MHDFRCCRRSVRIFEGLQVAEIRRRAEETSGRRVFDQRQVAEHVLLGRLDGIGPLRPDLFHHTFDVHGAGLLQSVDANVQCAERSYGTNEKVEKSRRTTEMSMRVVK